MNQYLIDIIIQKILQAQHLRQAENIIPFLDFNPCVHKKETTKSDFYCRDPR